MDAPYSINLDDSFGTKEGAFFWLRRGSNGVGAKGEKKDFMKAGKATIGIWSCNTHKHIHTQMHRVEKREKVGQGMLGCF